ncbi:syntaxin [Acrasis kona]|uniref:Syntaxin n=1 Tax=Acrasis kona TaxID=1008807 RepID=A0AAW2ZCG2_9EUKA
MNQADPYEVVKANMSESMNTINALHKIYLENLSSNSGRVSLDDVSSQLRTKIEAFENLVRALENTIQIVEDDPFSYNVDAAELRGRKQFIRTTNDKIRVIKEDLSRKPQKKPQQRTSNKQNRKDLMGDSSNDRFSKLDDSVYKDNQGYIDNQMQLQSRIIQQQEEGLDTASKAIDRVKIIVEEIGNEVDDQNKELDAMSRDVENTQGMLKRNMNKLNKLLDNRTDRCKLILIVILVVLILTLFSLIFII